MVSPGILHHADHNAQSPETAILGVGGSPRAKGNSDILLEHVIEGARQAQVSTKTCHLREYHYQGCIGCEKCRKDNICIGLKDGMSLLYPLVSSARGLVLVCPTHNYNVTAWMKAFIDRLYCYYIFNNNRPRGWHSKLEGQGRKAALVAVCEQVNKEDMGFTIEAMRMPLEALGYEIVGELAVYSIFDRGRVKKDQTILSRAHTLGNDLAKSMM